MHYFTSQLPAERAAARSLRASLYSKKKQSQQQDSDDDNDDNDEHDEPLASPDAVSDNQAPPTPFPHAPARTSAHYYGASQVYEEMAKAPIRLYPTTAPNRTSHSGLKAASALKLKHLNVLSTLMHRCLLDGDFDRAGRAWGIILRSHVAGAHLVDPRNNGRWGIGAEILLRRRSGAVVDQREPPPNTYDPGDGDMFSDDGFELAKEYYERLIIQHPHRRQRPHAINERSFYPAMFALWILEIAEKSKRAKRKAQEQAALQSETSMSVSIDSDINNDADNTRVREIEIHNEELARATEVADRLDQLIASPPFDQEVSLLQLRGHICLWMSHLHIATTASNEQSDADVTMGDAENNYAPDDEQLTGLANSKRELQQAQTYFQRAAENGAQGQAATLTSIEIKLRDLAQRLNESRSSPQDEYDSYHAENDFDPALAEDESDSSRAGDDLNPSPMGSDIDASGEEDDFDPALAEDDHSSVSTAS